VSDEYNKKVWSVTIRARSVRLWWTMNTFHHATPESLQHDASNTGVVVSIRYHACGQGRG